MRATTKIQRTAPGSYQITINGKHWYAEVRTNGGFNVWAPDRIDPGAPDFRSTAKTVDRLAAALERRAA